MFLPPGDPRSLCKYKGKTKGPGDRQLIHSKVGADQVEYINYFGHHKHAETFIVFLFVCLYNYSIHISYWTI